MFSIEFVHHSRTYYALIRIRMYPLKRQYYITIMNGDLESLLYGYHIIDENDGHLIPVRRVMNPEIASLQYCIIKALSEHLKKAGQDLPAQTEEMI